MRPKILRPGYNCWRIEHAHRIAFLVDPASYFEALRLALYQAEHSILILGWNFEPDTCLDPENATPTDPGRIKDHLAKLVTEKPELRVNVLIWDASVLFRPAQTLAKLDDPIDAHPRISLVYDDTVPIGGSHHDKVVVVDDAIAFVGGIDLTGDRWDTREHACKQPLRRTPTGRLYGPVHDMMIAVDGDAAAAVGDLARSRWLAATGVVLPPPALAADPWPPELHPDIRDAKVGIARTAPAYGEREAIGEAARLNEDAVRSARKWIYIETQYLASTRFVDCLVALLQAPDPPEIVAIIRYQCNGWVEEFVMGSNRDRLLRKLRAADRKNRFRAYHVVVDPSPDEPNRHLNVHAKLIIVDGRFVRIGSSNLNNRSMGLDTECDLAVEADDEATRSAITALRDNLLASHLGTDPATFAAAIDRCGGLIPAIELLNTEANRLCPFESEQAEGPMEPLPATGVLDPEEPIDLNVLRGIIAR